jgi:hypothetical protein
MSRIIFPRADARPRHDRPGRAIPSLGAPPDFRQTTPGVRTTALMPPLASGAAPEMDCVTEWMPQAPGMAGKLPWPWVTPMCPYTTNVNRRNR